VGGGGGVCVKWLILILLSGYIEGGGRHRNIWYYAFKICSNMRGAELMGNAAGDRRGSAHAGLHRYCHEKDRSLDENSP
jgi:hypothetical protein